MIHRKKNDLLYKDITCLCQSLTRLWVLCLVVLFLLGLGFAPSSVLDVSSVLFSAFVHQAVVFDGSLFRTWIGCSFFLLFSFLYASFQALFQAFFFLVLLVQAHCRAASHCFCLGLSPRSFHSTQVLFVVVLFNLVLGMAPLLVLTLSASFSVLFYGFYLALLLALFFS